MNMQRRGVEVSLNLPLCEVKSFTETQEGARETGWHENESGTLCCAKERLRCALKATDYQK